MIYPVREVGFPSTGPEVIGPIKLLRPTVHFG